MKVIDRMKKIVTSSQAITIILVCGVLGILIVLFRMKAVEQDYQVNDIEKKIKKEHVKNKELNAREARLRSSRNLHVMAKEQSLNEPTQDQIIVIEEKTKGKDGSN